MISTSIISSYFFLFQFLFAGSTLIRVAGRETDFFKHLILDMTVVVVIFFYFFFGKLAMKRFWIIEKTNENRNC